MVPPESDKGPDGASRKQRREQARQERRAAEAAAASAAGRRRRLTQLGGVVVAVIVVIVVIVIATGGGKGTPGGEARAPKTKHEVSTVRNEVLAELNGIHQEGAVLGNPKAPVTIQYFGDLECPICRDFTLAALPHIIESDVRTGRAKIEYKSFSTATGNAEAGGSEPKGTFESQQTAAYAAGKQNLGWYFIELFYHEQGKEASGYVTEKFIQGIAEQVPGLNLEQWSTARADKALASEVFEGEKAASKNGFSGTPSFMIGKTGGTLTQYSPSSIEESKPFEEVIAKYAA
ncbi:MAG: DsbA family protein [Solirubrobacteraceae bacterium]